ncbi:MAG TPA: hypothetical protein EYP56_08915 [Planctomycetaceae bacterium]|nr:hypothetical protein [Planctomycetaceae bacterium]HIQ22287.1 hypothetical protein [Planctomycetota bacterium]
MTQTGGYGPGAAGRPAAGLDRYQRAVPWHVGQYSGGPAEPYQVFGCIRGLSIYGRALSNKPQV